MILVGLIIGFIFDFYRVLKKKMGFAVYLINLCDFLIFIILSFIVFIRLIYLNSGQVRWYLFLGIFLGIIIYYAKMSQMIINYISLSLDISLSSYVKLKELGRRLLNQLSLILIKLKEFFREYI